MSDKNHGDGDNEWSDFAIGLVVVAILLAGIVVLPLALIGAGLLVLLKSLFCN